MKKAASKSPKQKNNKRIEIKVKALTTKERENLLLRLKDRFEKNMHRHSKLNWQDIEERLNKNSSKLWSLLIMEETGGEPDVIAYDKTNDKYIFCDCCKESPSGRRSLCYDAQALKDRKEHKPRGSAVDIAKQMKIKLLDEDQYRKLQELEDFDTKTSSWIKTPDNIRNLGGAIFADFRYDTVFIYHNGAQSYYASRGFRGVLEV